MAQTPWALTALFRPGTEEVYLSPRFGGEECASIFMSGPRRCHMYVYQGEKYVPKSYISAYCKHCGDLLEKISERVRKEIALIKNQTRMMKANEYRILADCVDNGITSGYARAHKYSETPEENEIKKQIYEAVMLEICEYFTFEDGKPCEED